MNERYAYFRNVGARSLSVGLVAFTGCKDPIWKGCKRISSANIERSRNWIEHALKRELIVRITKEEYDKTIKVPPMPKHKVVVHPDLDRIQQKPKIVLPEKKTVKEELGDDLPKVAMKAKSPDKASTAKKAKTISKSDDNLEKAKKAVTKK